MMRVLIGDSSAVSRSVQKEILKQTNRYEFCADAVTEKEFLTKLKNLKPDVIVLDSALFTAKRIESIFSIIKESKTPALIYVPAECLNYATPSGIYTITKPSFIDSSEEKLKNYALFFDQTMRKAEREIMFGNMHNTKSSTENENLVIETGKNYAAVCVGVSTGGPGTLLELLKSIDPNFPLPIFITQHIDSFFDKNLISWLNTNSPLPVHLAIDNIKPEAGHVYFAPSDYHLTFTKKDLSNYVLTLNHDEPVNFLRPSVDKMFESAAQVFGDKCIGVLLTGMGNDGAKGCCLLKEKGSYTITQDEKSCVIYGMPKAAYEAGGSIEVLPLNKIADRLKQLCEKKQ